MKILLIGNGGREHAICEALARSEKCSEIVNFASAVNPGIKPLVADICLGDLCDLDSVKNYAKSVEPDFAVIGPDDPIGAGLADALESVGVKSFAPNKKCAQLESSKSFTRNLLKKYNIDASPDFAVFSDIEDEKSRLNFYHKHGGQVVVKADGLLGGKGVLVAGDHFSEFEVAEDFAKKSIEKFGKVVLEEKLVGEEFSLISLVDGTTVLDTPAIQDYKRAHEGDRGPNTGGMGGISDENNSLPFLTEGDVRAAHDITVDVMGALNQELGCRFVGVMYGGFIVTKNGVKLIEYNARFGDPEALNIFPVLETDFVDVCLMAIEGRLAELGELKFAKKATVVKYLCPEGYPESPVKNVSISVDSGYKNTEHQHVYYAAISDEDGELVLKGSRAVGVVGIGRNLEEANKYCEEAMKHFKGPMFHRKDIGTRALVQQKIEHVESVRGVKI